MGTAPPVPATHHGVAAGAAKNWLQLIHRPHPHAILSSRNFDYITHRIISILLDGVKSPSGTINALFQKTLSEAEVQDIVAELTQNGIVVVTKSEIAYASSDEDKL